MPRDAYVAARCSEIDEILLYAADKGDTDPELGAHMAGYVSVLISGVVEDCIEHLVVQRARKVNDPQLQEFVRSSIAQQFRNPRSEDIANVIGQFSKDCQSSYQLSVGQEAREALGSIVRIECRWRTRCTSIKFYSYRYPQVFCSDSWNIRSG